MQASRATCSHNHSLGAHHLVLAAVVIPQHSARRFTLIVQQKLDGRSELQRRDAAVLHLVPQHAHNFSGVHTLTAGTAAMGRHHIAVLLLIEHHA